MAHIVVAVDGSAASQEALNQAANIARQSHADLTGIFVMDGGWPDYIGNDWQSSKGSRQGFLDYIKEEQEQQAEAARQQFEGIVNGMPAATFSVEAGDPAEVILHLANEPSTDLLVLSRRVFQVSGRPSLKTLGERLAKKATRPFLLYP
ncbi:MAG: universal stress protein [Gammaproteobacteria bacterium]|nr:universal stress protein [Gammaproteobacteria bacterium]